MRNFKGYTIWENFSRYLSNFLSHIFHMSEKLTDNSPINQLSALIFLSLSSLILVKLFSKQSCYLKLFATLALGMSPYYLPNMSFKYDAHYMSLALLASIVPFLFIKEKLSFWIMGIISLLVMLTTYQAANQIYIEVGIFYVLLKILENQPMQELKKDIIHILLLLILTTVIFKLIFVSDLAEHRHTSVSTFMPHELPLGVYENLSKYFSLIYYGIKGTYLSKIAISLLLLFPISIYFNYKDVKITIIAFSFLLLALFGSYGLYTVLYNPLMNYREFNGIGAFFAIVALFLLNYKIEIKKVKIYYLINILIIAFSYNFIVIANTYGNAIYKQENYNRARTIIMISDLNKFIDNLADKKYHFANESRNEITVEHTAKQFPLLNYILQERLQQSSAELHFLYLLPNKVREELMKGTKAGLYSIDCSQNQKLLKSLDNDFHKLEFYDNKCLKIFYK